MRIRCDKINSMDVQNRLIVHVEDGPFGDMFKSQLENGLAGDGVSFELRKDFVKLREELKSGDLAWCYILDNEVLDSARGAQMALEIHRCAQELGREVLVITMLCSAPDEVRKEYGDVLDDCQIPILSKLGHAALCGFWIGACIKNEAMIPFDEWIRSGGGVLNEDSMSIRAVQNRLLVMIQNREPGGFYQPVSEYVRDRRDDITEYMSSDEIQTLDEMFPPQSDGIERRG